MERMATPEPAENASPEPAEKTPPPEPDMEVPPLEPDMEIPPLEPEIPPPPPPVFDRSPPREFAEKKTPPKHAEKTPPEFADRSPPPKPAEKTPPPKPAERTPPPKPAEKTPPEPLKVPPEPAERKLNVPPEEAVKALLRRLNEESEELAEKAGIPEPSTPPMGGHNWNSPNVGIEERSIAGLQAAIQSSKALDELVEVVRNLKTLCLHNGFIGDKGVASLSRAFREANVKDLISLDISDNGFTDQGFHELTQTIATGFLAGLEDFNLSHNHIREDGSTMLARILHIGRLPRLLSLNLAYCYIGDYGMKCIARASQSGSFTSWGVQFLDLSTNAFGEESAVALFQSLSMGRLPYLKYLDVSFNMVGEKGTLALADTLNSGRLQSLTGLVLHHCYLSSGCIPITKGLEAGRLHNLEVLDLSSNYLGDNGGYQLAKALRSGKAKKLQKLIVAECGITPQGMELIPEALDVGKIWGLRHLDMSNNYLNSTSTRDMDYRDNHMEGYTQVRNDFGSFALARLMRSGHLSELRYLNLSRVSMTDDGLVALAEEMEHGRLPNLEKFFLTDNDIKDDRSLKALVTALVSGNLKHLQELDVGFNSFGEDLSVTLASALDETNPEVESPLVKKVKERYRMSKSPIERLLYILRTFFEKQLGVSLSYKANASNIFTRVWQQKNKTGLRPKSVPADEESVESTGNDNKLLFNGLLVLVWILAVWLSRRW